MQADVIEIKNTRFRFTLVGTWLVLLCIAALPWILLVFNHETEILLFIITHIIVLAMLAFIKINYSVTICTPKTVITHEWITLLGARKQSSINLLGAQILLNHVNYRGNDLLKLIVAEQKPDGQKIALTEANGFDRNQISTLYRYTMLSVRAKL
ncbi:hypothetical protein [Mucilaginibacter sp. CSA2-8R]|uniref:hypothetical protein n=1 Tax=Mucilaginibacter sp. CSA2-8R TaxID=3141542 RepID=UPI00315D9EEC